MARTGTTPIGATNSKLLKNYFINGNFDFWQRGVSVTNPVNGQAFLADRWGVNYDGTGSSFVLSRQAFTTGQLQVPGFPTYFNRHQVNTAGSGGTVRYMRQSIEDINTLAGKTVVVSFWAKADAAHSVTVAAAQLFGSGGSSAVNVTGSTVNLTTVWAKYQVTIVMPGISGKTVGPNSFTEMQFFLPTNTVFTIDFAQIMLNEGAFAAPFKTYGANPDEELIACLRYYEKSYALAIAPGSSSPADCYASATWGDPSGNHVTSVKFSVTKRTAPTFKSYNVSGGVNSADVYSASYSGTATITYQGITEQYANFFAFSFANNASARFFCHWTADAEL